MKQLCGPGVHADGKVVPFAGAWIETPEKGNKSPEKGVAPYARAWIETPRPTQPQHHFQVAPYAGAWIET